MGLVSLLSKLGLLFRFPRMLANLLYIYWRSDTCIHDDAIKWKHFPPHWPLWGEFTGDRWIPHTKSSDAELWFFFDLRLNKRLSKQFLRWWFDKPSRSLWRQCNVWNLLTCISSSGLNAWNKMAGHGSVLISSAFHYNNVKKSAMASQVTGFSSVYSTVCSGPDQRKHQCSPSLAFVGGIHRWPVNYQHKGPVTWNMFPFDDVIIYAVPYSIAQTIFFSL